VCHGRASAGSAQVSPLSATNQPSLNGWLPFSPRPYIYRGGSSRPLAAVATWPATFQHAGDGDGSARRASRRVMFEARWAVAGPFRVVQRHLYQAIS